MARTSGAQRPAPRDGGAMIRHSDERSQNVKDRCPRRFENGPIARERSRHLVMGSVRLRSAQESIMDDGDASSMAVAGKRRAHGTGVRTGAGFIGSHVVDAYLAAGLDVAVVDNLATGSRANLNPAARTFYEVDIRDAAAPRRCFAAVRPEIVSHQAAQASVRGSMDTRPATPEINVLGSLNVLEACRKTRRPQADLRGDRRRRRRRATVPARRRGSPVRATQSVRGEQARGGALLDLYHRTTAWTRRSCATQRLRAAPGSAEARLA